MNRIRCLILALASTCVGMLVAPAHAGSKCVAEASCVETRSFVAAVTGFRTSTQGRNRVLTVTVRFENKTGKPVTLGYVADSGVALDELGNRYLATGANAVRGIGAISGADFDPKFTLQPGEGSDARFELLWEPGKAKAGARYEIDLAIREITPTTGEQLRLGQEHALHFANLGAASTTGAAAASPAATPAATAPTDPCTGSPRCYNAGTFIAEVMQVAPAAMAKGVRHHSVAFNIRFRNVSDKPVILGYRSASSAALDNFGNAFTWGRPGTHDTSIKGIGIVTGRAADTQFTLAPGQSRNATFNLIRFNAVPPIGESWNYDVVIEEIEILPGQQVRSVRQNSLTFSNLAPGSFAGLPAAGAAAAVLGDSDVPTDATGVASKVIDLFNRAKKK